MKSKKEKLDTSFITRIGVRSIGEMKITSSIKLKNPKLNFIQYLIHLYKTKSRKIKKIILIVDEANIDIIYKINKNIDLGYQINYILTDSENIRKKYWTYSRIYPFNINIGSILKYDIIDEIVCCLTDLSDNYLIKLARASKQYGISLLLISLNDNKPPLGAYMQTTIANKNFNIVDYTPINNFTYTIKKMWDIIFTIIFLISFSWLFIIIAILIKSTSAGPVFFKQLRVGQRGRKFWIYKFRTMKFNADDEKESLKYLSESSGPTFKITNDPRITKIGKWLRKTNLDEIPQLINILIGDMALIGPRPMLPNEVNEQENWQLKRLSVKPGITGPWQIQSNKNNIPFEQWMKYDKNYIENWSIEKDIELFFRTIWIMFKLTGK